MKCDSIFSTRFGPQIKKKKCYWINNAWQMLSLQFIVVRALCVIALHCTLSYFVCTGREREREDRKSKDRDWDSTLHKHSQVRLCSSTLKAKFMWSINWNFNVFLFFPHFSFGTVVFHVYAYAFSTHLNGAVSLWYSFQLFKVHRHKHKLNLTCAWNIDVTAADWPNSVTQISDRERLPK